MDAENQIDYSAVIDDLENDRAELDALIAYIKRKKLGQVIEKQITPGPGHLNITGRPVTTRTGPGALNFTASDAFFGLGLIEATKKYLERDRKPKSARDIAEALIAGGFKTTSKDFKNTVFSVLAREDRQDGVIVKVNTDWGLPEWYPGLKRGKNSSPNKASTTSIVSQIIDSASNGDQKG